MATEQQYILSGNGARPGATQLSALVVNGNTTVKGPIVVPANSWLKAIAIETPTAISGTPTTCNVTIGTTDGGTDIMAAADAHTQGHIAGVIAATFDKVSGVTALLNTLYIQVTTAGGTSSAGTINVLVSYDPPQR